MGSSVNCDYSLDYNTYTASTVTSIIYINKMDVTYKALFVAMLSALVMASRAEPSWEQRFEKEVTRIAGDMVAAVKPLKDQNIVDGTNKLVDMVKKFLGDYGAPIYDDDCFDAQMAIVDQALEVTSAIENSDVDGDQLYDIVYDLLGWMD